MERRLAHDTKVSGAMDRHRDRAGHLRRVLSAAYELHRYGIALDYSWLWTG